MMETKAHYEAPVLEKVGAASDVVLGAVWMGDDIDTHLVIWLQEWIDG